MSMVEPEVMRDNFPIRKDSIEELVGHRNRAIELARQAHLMLQEASHASAKACPFIAYGAIGRGIGVGHRTSDYCETADYVDAVRKHIDRYAWESLLNHSGLRNLMDATAHEEFRKQLEKNPPEFSTGNIVETFISMANDAPAMLERSVLRVFDKVTHRKTHKTNSSFGIGDKIILTGAIGYYGWNSYGYTRQMVGDMDRLFHVLDGKKPPEAENFADAVGHAAHTKSKSASSEYLDAKLFFGNGNLHIKFLRPDLVTKVNRILTKHKGVTLPDDRVRV